MNKKGLMELADLGGFILIFIVTIVLGVIFVNLSPNSTIKIMDEQYSDYLTRYTLLDFLSHEENGINTADEIVLAVKNNNFDKLINRNREILDPGASYSLTIFKDDKVVYSYSHTRPEDEATDVPLPAYKWDDYKMNLANCYDGEISVKLEQMTNERAE